MLPGDADNGLVASGEDMHHNIQNFPCFQRFHPNGLPVQICPDGIFLLLGNGGDDLQNPVRIPGHDSRGGGSLDAPQAAGVGDDHTLYIFNDVAAGFYQGPFRKTPQGFSGDSRTVRNRDGLGTAHCGNQFLIKNPDIGPVANILFFHGITSVDG